MSRTNASWESWPRLQMHHVGVVELVITGLRPLRAFGVQGFRPFGQSRDAPRLLVVCLPHLESRSDRSAASQSSHVGADQAEEVFVGRHALEKGRRSQPSRAALRSGARAIVCLDGHREEPAWASLYTSVRASAAIVSVS